MRTLWTALKVLAVFAVAISGGLLVAGAFVLTGMPVESSCCVGAAFAAICLGAMV